MQTLNDIFHKTNILNFVLSCQILLNSIFNKSSEEKDSFKLKCRDYKEQNTENGTVVRKEKRICVVFEKKMMMWKFYDAYMEKFIKKKIRTKNLF